MGWIVGMDVAKGSIEVALEEAREVGTFPRTNHGLKRVVRQLEDVEVDRVVLAATALLARMRPVLLDLPNWKPMPEIVQQLRALSDVRDTLIKHRDDLHRTDKSASARAGNKPLKAILKKFAAEISKVEKDIEKLAKSSDLSGPIETLKAAKGVGTVTAVVLVVRMPELGRLTRAKAAALVGIAPMNHDSGDRHGRRKTRGGGCHEVDPIDSLRLLTPTTSDAPDPRKSETNDERRA